MTSRTAVHYSDRAVVVTEKLLCESEIILAVEAMARGLGRPIDAVMSAEIGGGNGLVPLVAASLLRLPVVDADGMGRAFPLSDQITYSIYGRRARGDWPVGIRLRSRLPADRRSRMSGGKTTLEGRRIALITPVLATDDIDVRATLHSLSERTLHMENYFIDEGPPAIETDADVVAEGRELIERQVASYGVSERYVSHHAIDIPVLELFHAPEATLAALEKAARAALEEGAETLLLGCTGLAELARGLRTRLDRHGLRPAVVEPLSTTIAIVHALLDAGVLQAASA